MNNNSKLSKVNEIPRSISSHNIPLNSSGTLPVILRRSISHETPSHSPLMKQVSRLVDRRNKIIDDLPSNVIVVTSSPDSNGSAIVHAGIISSSRYSNQSNSDSNHSNSDIYSNKLRNLNELAVGDDFSTVSRQASGNATSNHLLLGRSSLFKENSSGVDNEYFFGGVSSKSGSSEGLPYDREAFAYLPALRMNNSNPAPHATTTTPDRQRTFQMAHDFDS